jgi:tetratricopeptide (TPR) repeat protein
LLASIERLQAADLLQQGGADEADNRYHFRQGIIREAVYGTLLRTQRQTLHERVACWYERRPREDQPKYYPLLAYHWQNADNAGRELHYATLAGRRFAAEYANQAALSFLNRALELVDTAEQRIDLLWLRLSVWERIGERAARHTNLIALQELLRQTDSIADQSRLANAWAAYYRDISDYPAALRELQQGLELARRAADPAAEAYTLTLWGQIGEYQGSFRLARNYFDAALSIHQRIGDRRGEAENLRRIGSICYYLDDLKQARTYTLAALETWRDIKDRAGEAGSLANLGLIDMLLGDQQLALTWQQEALALAQSIGDRFQEANSYSSLAQLYQMQSNYAAARDSAEQAIRLFRGLGERRGEADVLNALGLVWRDLGQWEQARRCIAQALAIQQAIGDQNRAAYSHLNLGSVLQNDGATEIRHYRRALELARASGDRFAEAYALSYSANLARRQQDLRAAIETYQAALRIHAEINPAGSAETRAGLALDLLAAGNTSGAAAEIEYCLAYLATEGITGIEFPAQVWLDCYDGLRALGQPQPALECLERAR